MATLERALAVLETAQTDPGMRAQVQLHLARAVWAAEKNRPRARALLEAATPVFEAAPASYGGDLEQVAKLSRALAAR